MGVRHLLQIAHGSVRLIQCFAVHCAPGHLDHNPIIQYKYLSRARRKIVKISAENVYCAL